MRRYASDIGAERLDSTGYLVIKTAPGRWELKQRVEWEKVNGPLGNNVLRCLNGDKTDCRPENWIIRPKETTAVWRGRVMVRVDGKARLKAMVEYERHHGKLPPGHIVIHLNENREDFSPDNLRAVSRAQWVLVIQTWKKTGFKKGECKAFQYPIGTERLSKHDFIQVKVAHNQWRLKHHIEYEKHYGPIPKGMRVGFKDRNLRNFAKENLYAATAREILEHNAGRHLPPDVKDAIAEIRKLSKLINKIEKDGEKT